jgi:sugar phosphate isomerase/epimerase
MLSMGADQRDFVRSQAPLDVLETVEWLDDHGFTLTEHAGEGSFGSTWADEKEALIRITVDRSQWMLDIAHHMARR